MNDIRAKFEEIWPVPEGVFLNPYTGEYDCMPWDEVKRDIYVARLDTFTRCQETMAPVMSLVDEMVETLESCRDGGVWCDVNDILDRAKQIKG